MDIQKMVDERLEELRTRTIRIPKPLENAEHPKLRELSPSLNPRERLGDTGEELSKLGVLMDDSLTEMAERVLYITDRVAGDYARMEKDILNSRLALLQSAEAVLDIAIKLRRKAQSMITATRENETRARRLMRPGREKDFRDSCNPREGLSDGRVSMHDQGVASLFRRT